jgi:hypothetical protein
LIEPRFLPMATRRRRIGELILILWALGGIFYAATQTGKFRPVIGYFCLTVTAVLMLGNALMGYRGLSAVQLSGAFFGIVAVLALTNDLPSRAVLIPLVILADFGAPQLGSALRKVFGRPPGEP